MIGLVKKKKKKIKPGYILKIRYTHISYSGLI